MVLPNPRYSCPACPEFIEGSVAERNRRASPLDCVYPEQRRSWSRRAQGGQAHPLGAMSLNYIIQFDNS